MTEVRDSAAAGSPGAADQAKERAQQVAGQAQEKAQEAKGQAKNRLSAEVDNRSTQAGAQLRSTAGDVRGVADELRKQGKDQPARVAERAAERVEQVGGYLHESDGERILRDVEDFGRSKPWAVAAGGLVLGFAASRFLKASSTRRYEASRGGGLDRSSTTEPAVGAGGADRSIATEPATGAGGADRSPAWSDPLATPGAREQPVRPGVA